uniref:Uncharacterized protein n=1 Tax=Triticum urartu TaxID=4572 RepID=A0A8R7Q7Z8_TRIUA
MLCWRGRARTPQRLVAEPGGQHAEGVQLIRALPPERWQDRVERQRSGRGHLRRRPVLPRVPG